MIQRVKKPIKLFWMLLAIVIIALAVVLQIAKWSLPYINGIKPRIESFASEQFDATVNIGHISASWSGLRPEIIIDDLSLKTQSGEELLSINQASMQLDILLSLYHWAPVWQRVKGDGVNLYVTQSEQGGWSIGGYKAQSAGERGWQYRSPSALFLMARSVSLKDSRVVFSLFNKRKITSDIPLISIQNNGHFHRLTAKAAIGENSAFNFVLEGVGDPTTPDQFFAEAYLKLNRFPVERLASLFAQAAGTEPQAIAAEQTESEADAELWFDFASPSRFLMSGKMALLAENSSPLAKKYYLNIPVSADIVGDYSLEKGLSVGFRDINIDQTLLLKQSLFTLHDNKITAHIDNVNLSSWLDWSEKKLLKSPRTTEIFKNLSPAGELNNIYSEINLAQLSKSSLKANLSRVDVRDWRGVPEFKQISGYIETTGKNGFLLLDATNFSLFPKQVYDGPIKAKEASGYVAWDIDFTDKRASISGYQLSMLDAYGKANGHFLFDFGWKDKNDPQNLSLQIGLTDSKASYHQTFVPTILSEPLRKWMAESILDGQINDAGILLRGNLKKGGDRTVQFFADIEAGKLAINSDWPSINNINGRLIIDDDFISGDIAQAEIYKGDRLAGKLNWNKNKNNVLAIKAKGDSSAQSGLRFIRESWLKTVLGNTVDTVSGQGRIDLDLELDIPLNNSKATPRQNIDIVFNKNQLKINNIDLTFNSVEGVLNYSTQKGLRSKALTGVLFKQEIEVNVGGDALPSDELRVSGRGSVGVGDIGQWLKQPIFGYMQGQFDYRLQIAIPLDSSEEKASLSVYSDLIGVETTLPAPFNKKMNEALPFQFSMPFRENGFENKMTFGNLLTSRMLIDGDELAMSVAVSDSQHSELLPLPKKGIKVVGEFDNLDVSQWYDFFQQYSSANDGKKNEVNVSLSLESWLYNDKRFGVMDVSAQREDQGWSLFVDSDYASGGVYLDDKKESPIVIDLDKLMWFSAEFANDKPEGPVEGTLVKSNRPLDDLDPRSIPALNIKIKNLFYNDKPLGDWSMFVQPDELGVTVTNIIASAGGFTLAGDTKHKGASLRWIGHSEDVSETTQFNGILFGDDPSAFFKQWDIPFGLESKKTKVIADLYWQGSPMSFAIDKLEGFVKSEHKDGVFTQEKTNETAGALRLLGLLNFDSWARRIRLDFSDVYKTGLAFDELSGELSFDQGIITLSEPLYMDGPSSKLTLSGSINYPEKTVDTTLVATLPVSGNLTFVTAVIGGLPAAAGVYLVSKLLEDQVEKVTSINYAIRGDWDKPKVEVLTLGGDEQDLEQSDTLDEKFEGA